PAADGTVYALRATMREPPRVVALDAHTTGLSPASHRPNPGPSHRPNPGLSRRPNPLPTPGDDLTGPGEVERLVATADDGAEIPAWLILPPAAAHDAKRGAPLALLIHGGPVSSWNEWSWRWQPHVLAARGWAVVLPDPARSTGYGLDFVARGWGRWGAEPCTDVLACVEAAAARDDVDADRVAALGGSFGGYLANWIAGHTDRFAAIVSHASLWDLLWEREFGDPYADASRYREWSPRRAIGDITTPMLVIHGTKDYRVPESQGLALWTDLQRHGVESAYLAFPDEHHWVVTPAHSRVWYDTVIAWLDHHVLGRPWRRPPPV
ncbi:MAG: S9 family peptidase, partial [Actinobacteria bacterium QS_5_72_10]